jgi:hypothetical protein
MSALALPLPSHPGCWWDYRVESNKKQQRVLMGPTA